MLQGFTPSTSHLHTTHLHTTSSTPHTEVYTCLKEVKLLSQGVVDEAVGGEVVAAVKGWNGARSGRASGRRRRLRAAVFDPPHAPAFVRGMLKLFPHCPWLQGVRVGPATDHDDR